MRSHRIISWMVISFLSWSLFLHSGQADPHPTPLTPCDRHFLKEAQARIEEASQEMRKDQKEGLARSLKLTWIGSVRESLKKRFMIWNINHYPVPYIDDGTVAVGLIFSKSTDELRIDEQRSNASFALNPDQNTETKTTINGLPDTGLVNSTALYNEAKDEIWDWIRRYQSLVVDAEEILQRGLTAELRRKVLKEIVGKKLHYPLEVSMPLVVQSEIDFETIRFNSKQDLQTWIRQYRQNQKEIFGTWLSRGEIEKRHYLQVALHRKLRIVQDLLVKSKVRHELSADQLEVEQTLLELLEDHSIQPTDPYVRNLNWKEFFSEYNDLFRTLGKQEVVRKFSRFYAALTETDKKQLGLMSAGQYVALFIGTRWGVMAATVLLGGTLTWESVVGFVRQTDRVRYECACKVKVDEYKTCVKTYVKEQYPNEYVKFQHRLHAGQSFEVPRDFEVFFSDRLQRDLKEIRLLRKEYLIRIAEEAELYQWIEKSVEVDSVEISRLVREKKRSGETQRR